MCLLSVIYLLITNTLDFIKAKLWADFITFLVPVSSAGNRDCWNEQNIDDEDKEH